MIIGKFIRKIKRLKSKIRSKLRNLRAKLKLTYRNSYYVRLLRKAPLDSRAVFMESKSMKDVSGNIFYLLKELTNGNYPDFKAYLAVPKGMVPQFAKLFDKYGIRGVNFVLLRSREYQKMLATAKYLFNDTTFPVWYIKREGQIYLNTWHGTPLKKMGRDVWNRTYAIGNVQRNFLIADYLLYPSDYMKEKMMTAYMLRNIWKGTALLEGCPRNTVFFHPERGQQVREELGLADKKMILYMPTWRGDLTSEKTDELIEAACCYFHILDRHLRDDEIFFVKFPFFVAQKFDFDEFDHIRPIPEDYETYDFLNAADVMVTDYSGVFYDFANCGKKIVLFPYGQNEHLDESELYAPIDSLPFPQANNPEELLEAIRAPKEYDDTEFRKVYCKYDNPGAASRILQHVLLGRKCCKEEKAQPNGKENVLVYCSSFGRNGMTTSLLNLMNLVDRSKVNYYFTFPQSLIAKAPGRLNSVPDLVDLIPIRGGVTEKTFMEMIAFRLYFVRNIETKWVARKMKELFTREYQKKFGAVRIDKIIHYTGYAPYVTMMFLQSDAKRAIFVHNDMYDEIKEKGNQHLLTLQHAYREYDRVVAVSQAVKDSLLKIEKNQDNVVIVENAHFYRGVLEKAKQEFSKDPETSITMEVGEFQRFLKDSSIKKFITIGRFSEEKDHKKLIDAFQVFYRTHPDSALIIIGGYGVMYNKTVEYAASLDCAERIVIVHAISNPFTILKECSLFLLPSNREPLGLVLLEADTLGIPIVATDIPGSGDFLRRYHGYLVENSVDGLISGMEAYWRGEVKPLNISFEDYNQNIVKEFEHLFD